jgi:hypothetical protein
MYIIIAAPNMDSLIESVNNSLIDGFQPIGGMSIVLGRNPSSGLQETTMYQSMWKIPVISMIKPIEDKVDFFTSTPEPISPVILTEPEVTVKPKSPVSRAKK